MLPIGVADGVRPTASRVREALFSIVGQSLDGTRVLDAFGGSGLLGFEAWSRGATVVIVEREPKRAAAIRDAAEALGADVEVVTGDVLRRASGLGPFDTVLIDPPYREAPGPILAALAAVPATTWVLEHDADVAAPAVVGLTLDRGRSYGSSALAVYLREPAP